VSSTTLGVRAHVQSRGTLRANTYTHDYQDFSPFPALSAVARAQFGASVEGRIADPTGAAIPDAKVTLSENETQRQQITNTSGEGFYRFTARARNLLAYCRSAEFQSPVVNDIVVTADQAQGVNVTLQLGQVTQTVTVTSASSPMYLIFCWIRLISSSVL
jgi:hypothetical protein